MISIYLSNSTLFKHLINHLFESNSNTLNYKELCKRYKAKHDKLKKCQRTFTEIGHL